VTHVFFIEEGMVSLVAEGTNGHTVEVGLIGNEGMVGAVALLFPHALALQRTVVQVPGSAWLITTGAFLAAADELPDLREKCLRYLYLALRQATQTAACNALHTVASRFAKSILMTLDRVDGETVPLTHEYFAMMLGVRRASVTVAAGALQASGVIRYSRGRMTVLDRSELESVACECYRMHRSELEQIVGSADFQSAPIGSSMNRVQAR
jgi:CRP-like cAMP-binding protein